MLPPLKLKDELVVWPDSLECDGDPQDEEEYWVVTADDLKKVDYNDWTIDGKCIQTIRRNGKKIWSRTNATT